MYILTHYFTEKSPSEQSQENDQVIQPQSGQTQVLSDTTEKQYNCSLSIYFCSIRLYQCFCQGINFVIIVYFYKFRYVYCINCSGNVFQFFFASQQLSVLFLVLKNLGQQICQHKLFTKISKVMTYFFFFFQNFFQVNLSEESTFKISLMVYKYQMM